MQYPYSNSKRKFLVDKIVIDEKGLRSNVGIILINRKKEVFIGKQDTLIDLGFNSEQLLEILENAGATIKKIEFESIDKYLSYWQAICTAEAYNAHLENFPKHADQYGPFFKEWLEMGSKVSQTDYIQASKQRATSNSIMRRAFDGIDAMICPSVPRLPHDVDDSINYGSVATNRASRGIADYFQRFTVPFDYNGYPTISIPSGYSESGLPMSLQIVGHPNQEALISRVGYAFEKDIKSTWKHPID